MKKFAISLIALAAVSTVSFASVRDVTTPYGAQDTHQAASVSSANALVIPGATNGASGDDMDLGGSNRR